MLSWIIQITIVSVMLIFLSHYLINFFKSTLTVPKIKDLVNSPTQKYESMFNVIANKNNSHNSHNSQYNYENDKEYTISELIPNPIKDEGTNMKNELKNFLKKQMESFNNDDNTTSISTLDSIGEMNSFASYN